MAFSRDGKHLITFRMDWKGVFAIELWDPQAGKLLADWQKHSPTLARIGAGQPVFSSDGKLVALAAAERSEPGYVFVWDVATGRIVHRIEMSPFYDGQNFESSALGPVLFSPDSERIFIGLMQGIGSYHLSTGERLFWRERGDIQHPRDIARVQALAVSPDGGMLALGTGKGTICLRDAKTGGEFARWEDPGSVTALAFSPDGTTLASGNAQGIVKLWDIPFLRQELIDLGFEW
jgi:WD40 repeat protein